MQSEAKPRSAGKTVIYLVRHGAVHNPQGIVYGRLPGFPLSEEGRHQAHLLGKFLAVKNITAIYASPLTRTRETADILASYHTGNVIVQYDERILEVEAPFLESKSIHDWRMRGWDYFSPAFTKQGVERVGAIGNRMHRFLREMAKKHKGQEIVAVSHGDPIMIAMHKHAGRRLHHRLIHSEDFVGTARGYMLIFEEGVAAGVERLEF